MIYDHFSARLSPLDRDVVNAVPPGGNWRNLPPDFKSKRIEQIRRTAAQGEGSRSTYYGRLSWDRPSYTISTYFSRPGNGCFIHPSAPRLITVREAARLQSFPDGYRFFGAGRARFVQVGNAIPPLLAYQLALGIEPGPMVDLFAGAGGLSLGFEWAGHELVAAVDYDKAASKTFRENRRAPDNVLEADLSDAQQHLKVMSEIKRRAGQAGINLLAGGPPCQGFSTAGHCRLDDPRNRLVFAFVEAVAQLRPRTVLMENVPALMWRRSRPVLDEIRQALHVLGYETSVMVAHAEGYGVPQLRRRFFVLASMGGELRWPAPWCEVLRPCNLEYQVRSEQPSRPSKPFTVEDAIADLPLEPASSADSPVPYGAPARSRFQLWARGLIETGEFVPNPVLVSDRPGLFAGAQAV